jgi:L-lysine exporter family protein LysE/ArgO
MIIEVELAARGFALGAGLIVAIGAQNAFVLRLGLERHHVALAAAFCAGSDAVLIAAGGLGFGSVVAASPILITAIGIVGSAFLLAYGGFAAWRALQPSAMTAAANAAPPGVGATLAILATFTWANPHVYLDTVVLVGGLAGRIDLPDRLWFLGGAMLASFTWFFSLAYGARLLSPLFAKPAAWRVLDGIIAATMWVLAGFLARDTLSGLFN